MTKAELLDALYVEQHAPYKAPARIPALDPRRERLLTEVIALLAEAGKAAPSNGVATKRETTRKGGDA